MRHPHAAGWGAIFSAAGIDLTLHGVLTFLSVLGVVVGICFHLVGAVQNCLSGAQTRRLERERAAREAERHEAEMIRIRPARVRPGPGFESLN